MSQAASWVKKFKCIRGISLGKAWKFSVTLFWPRVSVPSACWLLFRQIGGGFDFVPSVCLFFSSSSQTTFVGNMKMQSKAVLVFVFFLFVGLSSGRFGSVFRGLQSMHVYWRFKDREIRAAKTRKSPCISQKPAKPLKLCWCVWLQTWMTATRGPSSPGTVAWSLPLMWSSPVTGHLGRFRCFGSFQPSPSA